MNQSIDMYDLAKRLFPICRSITGDGVRETLSILQENFHSLKICSVPSGTKVFDWTIPKEWKIREAYIKDSKGKTIIDFKENNLHVVGYSTTVDKIVTLDELLTYVYTLPQQPNAIPYVTSYYKEQFGFCMSENQKQSLLNNDETYHIYIDSSHFDGVLNYGEIYIPSTTNTKEEVFLSTYICHPSMANNELSGPVVAINLANELLSYPKRRYNYRIVFVPETIGSICYLSQHLETLQKNVIAGFNISCVGDDRTYSYIPTKYGNCLSDKVAKNVLSFHYPNFCTYSFLDRGSDERQYNAPGVDLPVCSILRSKFGEYPEYHTSLDNLSLISPSGLDGAFNVYKKCINALEYNYFYKSNCFCEPQLGKRGLYPNSSFKGSVPKHINNLLDFIAYCDGTNDFIDISNIINVPTDELINIVEKLLQSNLIEIIN